MAIGLNNCNNDNNKDQPLNTKNTLCISTCNGHPYLTYTTRIHFSGIYNKVTRLREMSHMSAISNFVFTI